ncbi:MAG: RNA methyltransferase [Patescibacteria group bacterium]
MTSQIITLAGRNTVHDALTSGHIIQSILLSMAVLKDPKIKAIESLAGKHGVRLEKVRPEQIDRLSESGKAQGVIAYLELPEAPTLADILKTKAKPFLLLLNTLDYEQNLGAVLRSAWAAGIDAVIVGNSGVHEITPVVAKVSQGAAAYVPLISMSLFQALTKIKEQAIPVIGVEVGLGTDYAKQKLTGPVVLVFGGEAAGLSEPLKKYCDLFVHIPMVKEAASLNVSVAVALVCFEKTRQERA